MGRRLLLGRLGLLLRRLRLLQRRLGLLRLRLWGRGSSTECRACGTAANIAAPCIDRPREMIRQAQPARCNHDEKRGILESMVF